MANKAGIVILNYNTYDDAMNCVKSIDQYEAGQQHQIYIVDNASADGSGERLQKELCHRKDVTYLPSEKNLGFSGGNNIGIQQALKDGCEYIFCLNSDIILLNNAISLMVESFERYPEVGVACPAVFDTEGNFVQLIGKAMTLGDYFAGKRVIGPIITALSGRKYRSWQNIDSMQDRVGDGMGCGCMFGMTASFVRESGCLDAGVFLYYEEAILGYMMQKIGKKFCFCAKARVIHIGQTATAKAEKKKTQNTRLYAQTSALYVLRKYAKTNSVICYMLAAANICIWAGLSVFRSDFRVLLGKYLKETKRVLNAAKQ